MILDISIIVIGLISTFVLAFASYKAKSFVVKTLFWICLFATGGIIIISGINGIKTNQELSSVKSDLDALRDFSSIAHLDAFGNPTGYGIGSDIKFTSELTRLLSNTYQIRDTKIIMNRDEKAEQTYRTVIKKYPNFPFGYYFLALCLRSRNDELWMQYALSAIDILKKTTLIEDHNANHDDVLNKLLSMVENGKGTEQKN